MAKKKKKDIEVLVRKSNFFDYYYVFIVDKDEKKILNYFTFINRQKAVSFADEIKKEGWSRWTKEM